MYWWGPFVLVFAFCMMEVMAWATHKFVMHGLMWHFHEDHHGKKGGFFERNDIFFLIYAIPSWLCIMFGMMYDVYFAVWIGYGTAAITRASAKTAFNVMEYDASKVQKALNFTFRSFDDTIENTVKGRIF